MDYKTPDYTPHTPPKGNGMAIAALICGIISLTGLLCLLPSFICGGIAVTLALLSKGKEEKMQSTAKAGLTLGTIGIVLAVGIMASSVYTVFSNPDLMEQYEIIYEQMYGSDFEDDMNGIFPLTPDPDGRERYYNFPEDTF